MFFDSWIKIKVVNINLHIPCRIFLVIKIFGSYCIIGIAPAPEHGFHECAYFVILG